MSLSGLVVRAGIVAAAALALGACGKYGPRGDAGLPPSPEGLAYPRVYADERMDPHRSLKSPAEQAQLQSDLLARKRQPRTSR